MTKSAEAVLADALSLSQEERAEIAEKLYASLDNEVDPDVDAAWEAEIRRRVAAIDAGTVKSEHWEVVMRRIEAKLNQQ